LYENFTGAVDSFLGGIFLEYPTNDLQRMRCGGYQKEGEPPIDSVRNG
jgi:hypothetical protein